MGSSGAGKTTFAKALAQRLGIPHWELDAIFWQPDWQYLSVEEFRATIKNQLAADAWVVDGNYRRVRNILWARADTVVFLDYPFWFSFARLLHRSWTRGLRQQELWAGNRESLRRSFLSRDSILLYTLKYHYRKRHQNLTDLQDLDHAHLQVKIFRWPRQAEGWLATLKPL
jgi:adenylate kinase family enzyme